ncbi:MAG: polysaccharide lyase family 7 protein [Polyangiaceae bacterium]|nr:polysaccharide lyase family 7 protein [Polyangiaceae bacterium]
MFDIIRSGEARPILSESSSTGWLAVGCIALCAACASCTPGEGASDGPSPGGGGSSGSESGPGAGGESTSGGADEGGAPSSSGPGGGGQGGAGGAGEAPSLPAELLDLSNWKLTLPISEAGDESPLEIKQPDLATYSVDPYFHLDAAKDGVIFQAHAGGATTSNSGYPRSELREMTSRGADLASWSTTSGTHTLVVTQAITHLPAAKPHVVAGQIHDDSDDVVMIRLEDEYLFVEGGGDDLGELDPNYVLGTPFAIKLVAADGVIQVYYNDLTTPKVEVEADASGCYFKAGVYTQSNTSTGDEPSAYGEVVVYDLSVVHQ